MPSPLAARVPVALALVAALVLFALAPVHAQSTARFLDSTDHWAAVHIEKMALKGVVRGVSDVRFEPNRSVTRLEAVVLLVRAMGLEARARATTVIPARFTSSDPIPDWARGYVAVAVEERVIDGSYLVYFNPNAPASRLDVAVFLVRAMKLEAAAERLAGEVLPFTDRTQVPVLWWGHVYLAANRNLMTGRPDGTFAPNASVTRAEMATVLSRYDDQTETAIDAGEVRGTVRSVAVASGAPAAVTVARPDGTELVVFVPAGVSVFRDGARTSVAGVAPRDQVTIVLSQGNEAAYLAATPPTVKHPGTVDAVGPATLTLLTPAGDRPVFAVPAGAEVRLDGVRLDLASLARGMPAVVEVTEAGRVVRVWADRLNAQVTGTVAGVDFGPQPVLRATVETFLGPQERAYRLAAGATVLRDGAAAGLADLRRADQVTVTLEGGVATRVAATSIRQEVQGTVKEVKIAEATTVTITRRDGTEATYRLGPGAVVRRGDQAASLLDLTPGTAVTLELRTDVVARITIRGVDRYDYLLGVVKFVQGATVVVEVEAGSPATSPQPGASREVRLDASTVIVRFGNLGHGAAVNLLKAGDRVFAAGSWSAGVLTARSVTVLEAAE